MSGGRVNGIQADSNLAFQVLADGFIRQHEGYVCPILACPEVVVPPAFRVRPHGLQGAGSGRSRRAFGNPRRLAGLP